MVQSENGQHNTHPEGSSEHCRSRWVQRLAKRSALSGVGDQWELHLHHFTVVELRFVPPVTFGQHLHHEKELPHLQLQKDLLLIWSLYNSHIPAVFFGGHFEDVDATDGVYIQKYAQGFV